MGRGIKKKKEQNSHFFLIKKLLVKKCSGVWAGDSRAWAPAAAVIRKEQLRGDEDERVASKGQFI